MSARRVLVLFGGRSTEHAISCVSAGCVLEAMDRTRWEPVPVGITREGGWVALPNAPQELPRDDRGLPQVPSEAAVPGPPDAALFDGVEVVFPLLHGPYGEDGTVQGLLEMAGLPYVGSGVLASAAAMDKIVMKRLLIAAGLPVGPWLAVPAGWRADPAGLQARVADLPGPWFVKPARGGSSLGISRVTDIADLPAAIEEAAAHDPRVLVEAGIAGREIECGVLAGGDGPQASPPGEIVVSADRAFYDFEAKYLEESAVSLEVPADLPPDRAADLQRLAIAAFGALGCEGLARVDFFVGDQVLINEVNTMPGFTPQSMFPRMWQAGGVAYPDLVDRLLTEALSRPATLLR